MSVGVGVGSTTQKPGRSSVLQDWPVGQTAALQHTPSLRLQGKFTGHWLLFVHGSPGLGVFVGVGELVGVGVRVP